MNRARPEALLQKSVVRTLALMKAPGVLFFSVPNEAKRTLQGAMALKAMGMRAGVSDLVLVVEGRPFFLELKTEDGRQSTAQLEFESDAVKAGAVYAVAYSFDDAVKFLTSWRALRPGVHYGSAA